MPRSEDAKARRGRRQCDRGKGISGRRNSRSRKHSHEAAPAGKEQVSGEDGRETRLARLVKA